MIDAFAYLPNEIINDVVAIAGEKRNPVFQSRTDLQHLVSLRGLWGEFSRSSAPVMLLSNNLVTRHVELNGHKDESLSIEEAKSRPIAHCVIDGRVDFDLIRKMAPNLYESLVLFCTRVIPGDVLNLLGDRFSLINCSEEAEETAREPVQKEVADFLKRQLRSKHLRQLDLHQVCIQNKDFDDLFVEFVKRPTFERLICSEWSHLSAQVFLEADRAWLARSSFQVSYQKVSGLLTGSSLNEVTNQLKIVFDNRQSHPNVVSAFQVLKRRKICNDKYQATIEFFNGFEGQQVANSTWT